MAVFLSTGVDENDGQLLIAFDNNDLLQIFAHWPEGLSDTLLIHNLKTTGTGVPRIEPYHLRIQAYRE